MFLDRRTEAGASVRTPAASLAEGGIAAALTDEILKDHDEALPAGPMRWTLPGFESKARVATNFGDLPIEALRVRDRVRTLSGAFREVKWIDRIRIDADFTSRHTEADPILIRAKSLGQGYPSKDMLVSPAQTVWVPSQSKGWVGVTAMQLAHSRPNIHSIHRTELTYYRFHCGEPETVCVEGGWFCTAP